MFEVKQKVLVNNPKSQSPYWHNAEGTIVQILKSIDANGKEHPVHIVRLSNGLIGPLEAEYIKAI